MSVKYYYKRNHKYETVCLDLLDGVQIEEDVSVDLREAREHVQNFEIPLVLKVFIRIVVAFRLIC